MSLPPNCLIEHPNGRWSFVGRVDAKLAYRRVDGAPMTNADAEATRQFGPRLAGVTGRSWNTREEALADAEAFGAKVTA